MHIYLLYPLKRIESADINGNDRRVLVEGVPHPYGLTVAGAYLFWTDWKLKTVGRVNKHTGEWTSLRGNTDGLMDIQAVDMAQIGE